MALSVDQTKEIIRGAKNADSVISNIKFSNEGGSQTGTANAWAYLHALASNLLSQLFDKHLTDTTEVLKNNIAATPIWIKNKILAFQNGDSVEMNEETGIVEYPFIDATKQIVTQCSVTNANYGEVNIKVAKGGTDPVALDSGELTAVQSYYANLNPAGIRYNIISLDADRLLIRGVVYYDGQYQDSIQTDVETAVNAYLAALPFDGAMVIKDLEQAINAVAGVEDIVIQELSARDSTTDFDDRTRLIDEYKLTSVGNRKWDSVSGYMKTENQSGHTIGITLTYAING
jgi:hypothetical protein